MKFWDSSAVVPICIEEPRSAAFRRAAEDDPAVVAWWASPVECCSALARLRREGILDERGEENARSVLKALSAEWIEIQPGSEVRERAERLLLAHPLSAADSLQLAAALTWTRGHPTGRSFVCADRRLAQAARKEGLTVEFPSEERG